MTEVPSMPPLVKIGTHCSIPDRRTTTLKNAKFISQCQFATINYRTLGEESILLPTGDVFTKGSTSIIDMGEKQFTYSMFDAEF